ncbi:uncharacterized protein LOC113312642 [Papaver somniferum]|uniref:uncharacterized protein LOC113312642 n=1 Tax=Papaver somniferum TaxID=3469 RepID=UPI000E704814|nr:uncharacterized protein LOC113312642 [Papaver somniferum]
MDHILWECTFNTNIWHWLGGIFCFLNPSSFEDVLKFAKGKSSAIQEVWYNCAFKGNHGNAGLGFVARNDKGGCLGACSGGLGIATNYLAELMALVVAGEWAVKKRYGNICFSLDSKAVLLAFSNGRKPWIVVNIWNNIRKHISRITFIHSYREINFSADKMPKQGVLLARGTIIYYEDKPNFLNQLESEDG